MHRTEIYINIMMAMIFIIVVNNYFNIDAYQAQYATELQQQEQEFTAITLKSAVLRGERNKHTDTAITKAVTSVEERVIYPSIRECDGKQYMQLEDKDGYGRMNCFKGIDLNLVTILPHSHSDSLFTTKLELYGYLCDTGVPQRWYYLEVTMDYSLNIEGVRCFDKKRKFYPVFGNGKRPSNSYSCQELEHFFTHQQKI